MQIKRNRNPPHLGVNLMEGQLMIIHPQTENIAIGVKTWMHRSNRADYFQIAEKSHLQEFTENGAWATTFFHWWCGQGLNVVLKLNFSVELHKFDGTEIGLISQINTDNLTVKNLFFHRMYSRWKAMRAAGETIETQWRKRLNRRTQNPEIKTWHIKTIGKPRIYASDWS